MLLCAKSPGTVPNGSPLICHSVGTFYSADTEGTTPTFSLARFFLLFLSFFLFLSIATQVATQVSDTLLVAPIRSRNLSPMKHLS